MGCFLHRLSEILKHDCQEIQAIPETFPSLGYQSPRQLMTLHQSFILDSWSPQKSIVFHYQVQLGHQSVNELLQLLYRVSLTSQLLLTRGKHADSHRNKSEHRFALQSAIQRHSEQGHFQDTGHTLREVWGQNNHPRPPKGLSQLQTTTPLPLEGMCQQELSLNRTHQYPEQDQEKGTLLLLPLVQMKQYKN